MAIGGRRPKPTAMHLVDGTYRADRHSPPSGVPLTELPKAPRRLGPSGRSYWRAVGAELVRAAVITRLDLPALEALSATWERYTAARAAIARNGGPCYPAPNGLLCTLPDVAIENKSLVSLRHMWAEFGLTPSARQRARLGIEGEVPDPDLD